MEETDAMADELRMAVGVQKSIARLRRTLVDVM